MAVLFRTLHRNPIIIVLILLALVFGLMNSEFLAGRNVANILRQSSMLGFVALGMSFVILTRGIDLSVGATIALSSVLVAGLSSTLPPIIGIHAALAAGAVVGLANGLLITRFKFQPIIVTLSTMAVVRGLAMVYSDSRPIFGTLPDVYYLLAEGTLYGVPVPMLLFILVCLASGLLLNFTTLGRQIYQVGGNEEAARLAGVNVDRVKILTYVLSGVLSAFSGLILVARMRSGDAVTTGIGWELDAIAAAAIGGMSLMGGVGTVIGTFCGTLIIGMMGNAFNLLGVNPYWQRIVVGIVLAVAVATYSSQYLRAALMVRWRAMQATRTNKTSAAVPVASESDQ
jgi:ribose/xylose/arabinose/galactoside ABC-type transport system permease subunit